MSAPAPLADWEGMPVDAWRVRWRLPVLAALPETPSTNDAARALADRGAAAGTLVMSEHQTAGRGRMMRTWADAPGRSLLLSFVLRPTAAPGGGSPGTAPIRVGMAVARALRAAAPIDARIKWPNDVVIPRGKLAGILCEASSSGGETVIIAGIGINVFQQHGDWPPALRGLAVSMAEAADATPSRPGIMDALTAAMQPLFTRPLAPLTPDEIRQFEALDALRGRAVSVSGPITATGVAAGIDADGALLLDSDGVQHRITSGTVRVTVTNEQPAGRATR